MAHERRSLAFFHHLIAPVLSGPLNNQFWTIKTASVAHQDGAVKHAILALNSYFEAFHKNTATKGNSVSGNVNKSAMEHYNTAIHSLSMQGTATRSMETVLVLCILFVSIEYAQGDPKTALKHLIHGTKLLNACPQSSPELRTMFRHLSVLPRLSGADISKFPMIQDANENLVMLVSAFTDEKDAERCLDPLYYECARLSTSVDSIESEIALNRRTSHCSDLLCRLNTWWSLFVVCRNSLLSTEQLSTGTEERFTATTQALSLLESRWLVARIWISVFVSPTEATYDTHIDKFRSIVSAASRALQRCRDIKEMLAFNIGFSSLLYFTALKCRHLDIRLEALSLMEMLHYKSKTVWHQPLLSAAARRTIELEHDVHIIGHDAQYIALNTNGYIWATTKKRIVRVGIGMATALNPPGYQGLTQYNVPFLFHDVDDGVSEVWDIVTIT